MNNSGGTKRVIMWAFIGSGCLLLIAVFVVAIYYTNEVRVARRDTQVLVASALKRYGAPLSLADLSSVRKAMLLAIEDPAFYRHRGVDLETGGAGMTTITQGIVKLIYFPDGFRPGIAKIRQTLIAHYALDSLVSKEDQIFLFLNIAYLGHKDGRAVHGYADGARTYFGKEFDAITDEEFLSLVAMLISPNALQPGTPAHAERMKRIHAYLSGEYKPAGLLDVEYNGKRHGTLVCCP